MQNQSFHKISIAPMMGCTDKHFRYFIRLISPHALVYTEMITVNALIHGDFKRFLSFHHFEHPIALQLGGSDPKKLAYCSKLGEEFGYDEINLNVGCPSDRVKSGQFGACLMLRPDLVSECIHAMSTAVKIPTSVKCRIGVDEVDSYEALHSFIDLISKAGCSIFIIHARKAWLNGLSPKENREIPPLRYEVIHQVKKDFPHLTIILNGGINTLQQVNEQLQFVDGLMIGREAYSNPFFLHEIEKKYFPVAIPLSDRFEIIKKLMPYVNEQLQQKNKLSKITKHILGLFQGQKGARLWRRYLSENAYKADSGIEVIETALQKLGEFYV